MKKLSRIEISFIIVMVFLTLALCLWLMSVNVSETENAWFHAAFVSVFLALMSVIWFMKCCIDKAKVLGVLNENEEENRYVNN